MAYPIADVIGRRFGQWTVTERSTKQAHNRGGGSWFAVIRCNDCGNIRTASVRHLRKRPPQCGCLGTGSGRGGKTIHGHSIRGSYTPEYKCWRYIKQRCLNQKTAGWRYYGGRGIGICQEWQDSYEAFYAHVGPRPTPEHSIDRIDVNGNYEPGNVRWATRLEQANNKRPRASIGASCG